MEYSRRLVLRTLTLAIALLPFRNLLAGIGSAVSKPQPEGNFRFIYGNKAYQRSFHGFLANVFNLYPEDDFHQLIEKVSKANRSDLEIYIEVQRLLGDIKPFLSELTYALPALRKQKQVIAKQTIELLPGERRYEGYLEVGSNGRYLDDLEEQIDIRGDRFYVSDFAPSYSPMDMVDRGQIFKGGSFISLNNYRPDLLKTIPKNSLDLVTVYIGFHHCPINLREQFIGSIRDSMKPGASLIVRDHNAHNEKMKRMVALAHDVFNMGTNQDWSYNEKELRNFYSLGYLNNMLTKYGFRSNGKQLYQEGDPTLNALMIYKKA